MDHDSRVVIPSNLYQTSKFLTSNNHPLKILTNRSLIAIYEHLQGTTIQQDGINCRRQARLMNSNSSEVF